MVKNQHICFMIFHHGIDSISMDISMHRIEIIEIENNLSNREKILNNDSPRIWVPKIGNYPFLSVLSLKGGHGNSFEVNKLNSMLEIDILIDS